KAKPPNAPASPIRSCPLGIADAGSAHFQRMRVTSSERSDRGDPMLDPAPDHRQARIPARPGASTRLEVATQVLAGLALLGILQFHLLGSLLAGLLVYELVHALAPNRSGTLVQHHTAKVIVVALLAAVI